MMQALTMDRAKRWRDNPAGVDEIEHLEHCQGGQLSVEGRLYRCPVCRFFELESKAVQQLNDLGMHRYLELDWDSLQPVPGLERITAALRHRLHELVEGGHHLLLWGPPGRGKTQLAVLALRQAIRQGYSARLHNIGSLAVQVRERYNNKLEGLSEAEALEQLAGPDLLILDDLGAGETAGGQVEQRLLYLALERRLNARKATILTSNLSPGKLAEALGQRIYNRLQPLTVVEVDHGINFRLKQSRWEV